MEIGKDQKERVVEPLFNPVPQREVQPAPPEPEPLPEREPVQEPEEVPA
jgi:hypothetical protein